MTSRVADCDDDPDLLPDPSSGAGQTRIRNRFAARRRTGAAVARRARRGRGAQPISHAGNGRAGAVRTGRREPSGRSGRGHHRVRELRDGGGRDARRGLRLRQQAVDLDQLAFTLERAAKHRALTDEVKRLRRVGSSNGHRHQELLGSSVAMHKVHEMIDRVRDHRRIGAADR